jgi:hypothetical protein
MGLLRTTLAVVFGFMSLAHAPIMTFARADAAVAQHQMQIIPRQHQHDHSIPAPAEHRPICNAAGCFVLVAPPTVIAPAVELFPGATLIPATPRPLLSTSPEPADPPPRLQA